MTEQIANTVTVNLNGAIDAVVTSVTMVDASALPSSGDFRLLVNDELMLVTGVAGNVLTVTRGIEGTTAAAHADGRAAKMVLSAAALTTIIGEAASPHVAATIYSDASQTLTNDTPTQVQFASVGDDSDGFADVANDQLVVPAGFDHVYVVMGYVRWAAAGAGDRQLYVYVNGAHIAPYVAVPAGPYAQGQQLVCLPLALAEGDTVELMARHTRGANLDLGGNSAVTYRTTLMLYRVG